jgi:hypothetical protein
VVAILSIAPLGVDDGRDVAPLVVSPGDLETADDQTPHLATIRAKSGASSAPPFLRALAQLSTTMIMLAGAGELGYARAVHEMMGKLLNWTNPPTPMNR